MFVTDLRGFGGRPRRDVANHHRKSADAIGTSALEENAEPRSGKDQPAKPTTSLSQIRSASRPEAIAQNFGSVPGVVVPASSRHSDPIRPIGNGAATSARHSDDRCYSPFRSLRISSSSAAAMPMSMC